MLFRNIVLIFSLEKQCYLENRAVRELCNRRTACRILALIFLNECDNYLLALLEQIQTSINF